MFIRSIFYFGVVFLGSLLNFICSNETHSSSSLSPSLPSNIDRKQNIYIGLALDERSASDAVLLIHSILQTARRPNLVHFLILACGHNEIAATHLRRTLQRQLTDITAASLYDDKFGFNDFFGGWSAVQIKADIRAFTLPEDSGFAVQLAASSLSSSSTAASSSSKVSKRSGGHRPQHSHWNSPSGADMARFFLPQQFADVVSASDTADRILYLDNDIVVSCCIEEIFFSELKPESAVGVVLDDLKWATATQFERHYNASHPLVARHMRHGHLNKASTITGNVNSIVEAELDKKEFLAAVPRYPNDGVLLFSVSRYISGQVLEDMDAIARANAEEFVVNLGTQQFTVLALHDRWTELSPRANLRHFPDMARGFLMWFYYHGVLHYAGQSKPAGLCQTDSPLSPFQNTQRMSSLTPWLVALQDLYLRRHAGADLQRYTCSFSSTSLTTSTAVMGEADGEWRRFCARLQRFAVIGNVSISATQPAYRVLSNWNTNIINFSSSSSLSRKLRSEAFQQLKDNPFGSDLSITSTSSAAIDNPLASPTSATASDAVDVAEDETLVPYLRHSGALYTSSAQSKPPPPHCLSMLATAPDLLTFLSLVQLLANGKREENIVYLRLGSLVGEGHSARPVFPYVPAQLETHQQREQQAEVPWSASATQRYKHWSDLRRSLGALDPKHSQATFFPQNLARLLQLRKLARSGSWWHEADWIRVVDDLVATGAASWSAAVFPFAPAESAQHTHNTSSSSSSSVHSPALTLANSKSKSKSIYSKTEEIVREKLLRDYAMLFGDSFFAAQSAANSNVPGSNQNAPAKKPRYHYTKANVRRSLDVFTSPQWSPLCQRAQWRDFRSPLQPSECLDTLPHLRLMHRKHWEVVLVAAQTEEDSGAPAVWRMLAHLAALDLHFMRPPLIFLSIRLNPSSACHRQEHHLQQQQSENEALLELRDWMRKQGYVLGLQHSTSASPTANCNGEGGSVDEVGEGENWLYLWGVRMNHAEVATAMQNLQQKE